MSFIYNVKFYPPHSGNDYYQNKYLKYKSKYIALRDLIGGVEPPRPQRLQNSHKIVQKAQDIMNEKELKAKELEEICEKLINIDKYDKYTKSYMHYYIKYIFNKQYSSDKDMVCKDTDLEKINTFADNIYNLLNNKNVNVNGNECKTINETIICNNKNLYNLLKEYNNNSTFTKGPKEQELLTKILECTDITHTKTFDHKNQEVLLHHLD